jgi:hypothetical protein
MKKYNLFDIFKKLNYKVEQVFLIKLKLAPIQLQFGKSELQAIHELIFNNLSFDDFYKDY